MIRTLVVVCSLCLFANEAAFAQFGGGGMGMGGGGMGMGMGGVYIDPDGVMRYADRTGRARRLVPDEIAEEIAKGADMRRISLRSLDKRLRGLDGKEPEPELAVLAGLSRLDYVILDRENRDVWLVGPAEAWGTNEEGRQVGVESGRSLLQLEDLAAALRCVLAGQGSVTCSIDPQKDGLAALQRLDLPVATARREAVSQQREIEEMLGLQTVHTSGVPRGSRFARVMIEADYRMKRLALEAERFRGLPNHLDVVASMVESGESRADLLARWWFSPKYDAVVSDARDSVFQFQGQGVQLLNEAVFLDESGARHGSGGGYGADWDRFSAGFTEKFEDIAARNPVFTDLKNLFDLMMVAGLIRQQGLAHWLEDSALLDDEVYPLQIAAQPDFAEPVVSFRMHSRTKGRVRTKFCTFVWGGVDIRPLDVLASDIVQRTDAPALAAIDDAFETPQSTTDADADTAAADSTAADSKAADSAATDSTEADSPDADEKTDASVPPVAKAVPDSWWQDSVVKRRD